VKTTISRALGLSAALLVLLIVPTRGGSAIEAASVDVLRVSPKAVNFGTKQVGTFTVKGAMVTNSSANSVILAIDGHAPDDFSWGTLEGQTCPVLAPGPLAPGESCQAVMGFRPSDFWVGQVQSASLDVTASDPVTGALLATEVITFTGRNR
jgi:hypothetical protein